MKLISSLLTVVALCFTITNSKAQLTSQNLITPSSSAWSGSVPGTAGGFSGGGSGPSYDATTNTLTFGYTSRTATQNMTAEAFAIQHALNLSNSGIKIQGYNYSWQINNSGQSSGTLSGQVSLMRGNTALETYNYNYNAPTNGFELKTGTQNFTNEYNLLAGDAMTLSFTGKDSKFWAGYYGPQVREPSLTLNYTVDPCMANPLYSPSCPGFNNVLTSQNILGNEYGVQSYAINQALSLSGSNVKINGFKYGYDLYVGGDWCYFGFIICLDTRPSSMAVDVNVTSSSGTSLYAATHDHTQQNTFGSYNYSYVFPTQQALSSMGNFSLTPRQFGTGAVYSSWSNWQYTPDPCVVDPLSSSSCPGYAAAYLTQQCTISALYDSSCPGYAAAFLNQQCTINQLYSPSCPGYAAAYLVQQCTANPLYSTTCPGYEQAYLNAQCIKDSLYSTKCEGYATAYAIKYLTPISSDSTVASAVNGSLSNTAAVVANDPANSKVGVSTVTTTVSNDGTLSTSVSTTGDTNVDKAIAPKTTSTTGTSPSAPVQLSPPPPAPAAVAQRQERQEDKKDDKKQEQKPEGGPQQAQGPQQEQKSDQPKTARQELQERKEVAARKEAVEKGKDLANQMGKVADMESQKMIQNVVIQAMGFTPGFDNYFKGVVPDGKLYKSYVAYPNQRNVDNARLGRGLFGATDRVHNEMVESQFKLGN